MQESWGNVTLSVPTWHASAHKHVQVGVGGGHVFMWVVGGVFNLRPSAWHRVGHSLETKRRKEQPLLGWDTDQTQLVQDRVLYVTKKHREGSD